MSIAEMKKELKGVYTGLKWQAKVEKMSDKQIIAVYYKMLNEGKIKKSIANTITDMILSGASDDDLERAIRHSMDIIDAQKHNTK